MRNTKTNKVWSAVLSFALVISSVTGFQAGKVKAASEKETLVVYVAAQGKNQDGSRTVDLPKTAVQVEEGATASDAVKKALDTSAYKDNYTISTGAYGDSLDDINGITMFQVDENDPYSWAYWSFMLNGNYSDVGISGYQVKDQDRISLIFTYDNANVECESFQDDASKNPDEEAQKLLVENAKKQQNVLAQKIYETQFASGKKVPGIENADGLYCVFSLAQAGLVADTFFDAVYEKVAAQFAALENGGVFYDTETNTEITYQSILENGAPSQYYSKIALCVAALGKDPTNVGGANLIEKLASRSVYDASSVYSRESMILFAIDAKNSELPTGDGYLTRAELVNKVVADVDTQIGVAIEWGTMDSAAMVAQALAPYTTGAVEGIDKDTVWNAGKKVLNLLGMMQKTDGTYGDSYTPNNPWTLAQIMVTLGVFGVNPCVEADGFDFIKNGKTVFDAASAFVDVSAGTVEESLMGFQPEQLLRGLNACVRVVSDKVGIYNCENVDYTAKDSIRKPLTAEMIGPQIEIAYVYQGKPITIGVALEDNGTKLQKDTDFTVSYQNNEQVGTAYAVVTGTGNYILSQRIPFAIVEESTPELEKPVIKKVTSSKKKTLTVTFQKVDEATKYVVEISKNKKFKKVTKKTVKKTTAKFTKLSSGKKYYVRVKAYAGVTESGYSKVVGKKVK